MMCACVVGCASAPPRAVSPTQKKELQAPARDASALEPAIQSCRLGHGESCYLLGVLHDYGVGVKQDDALALTYHRRACDRNFVPACVEVASHEVRDHATLPFARDRALEVLAQYCEDGFAVGCYSVGRFHVVGEPKVALAYWEKGCALGDVASCVSYMALVFGDPGSPSAEIEKAKASATRCCAADIAPACLLLGVAVRDGKGAVSREPVAAERLFGRACKLGQGMGCFLSGMLLVGGSGVPKNSATAGQRFEQGCSGPNPVAMACVLLAEAYEAGGKSHKPDLEQAARYRERARAITPPRSGAMTLELGPLFPK